MMIFNMSENEFSYNLKELGADDDEVCILIVYYKMCREFLEEDMINKSEYQEYIDPIRYTNLKMFLRFYERMSMLIIKSLVKKQIPMSSYHHYVSVSELAYNCITRLNSCHYHKE